VRLLTRLAQIRALAVFALTLLAFAPVVHAQGKLPGPVARALAQQGIPESAVGVYVQEVGARHPVIAAGAARPFNPASTMKLVTTWAALDLLGPAYTWKTEIYAAGTMNGDVLEGDLLIKGYGDPKLNLENFWLALRDLRSRGVREIRGNLVLDRSHFSAVDADPGRFDGEPSEPYNTPPDALLVNHKAVRVQLIPDAAAQTVRIVLEPALPPVTVANSLKLGSGNCGDWMSRMKFDVQGNGQSARLAFSGTMAASCGVRERYVGVLAHPVYTHALFTAMWRELGGVFSGGWREGTPGPDSRLLLTVRSPPLAEVVRDINKFSNNVMARQLFLTLGAAKADPPATAALSDQVIKGWLAQRELDFPELVLENGSGLSRIERISAAHLGTLLIQAFASPTMPEFIASLPVVAVDGTMKKRLNGAGIAGQAHIKTGLLNGVRAIAGYVLDARGRRMVVVFLVNHPNYGFAQAAQDALLKWIYERGARE
jgi:D-alanyl-D-alanine carboxypeptidase/D-alanyl-D-alanine-endopeptidase (penicillin-binding protein 4)